MKKAVLKDFAKFTGKHLCLTGFRSTTLSLLKKRLWHRCFPVDFAKFQEFLFHRPPLDNCFCNVHFLWFQYNVIWLTYFYTCLIVFILLCNWQAQLNVLVTLMLYFRDFSLSLYFLYISVYLSHYIVFLFLLANRRFY